MIRVPRLVRKRKQRERRELSADWSEEQVREYMAFGPWHGYDGFNRFCGDLVWVEDAETDEGECRLQMWEGQEAAARHLCLGRWLLVVKARQLGITWLWAAYVVYRCLYARRFRCIVVFQQLEPYGYEFITRIKYILDRLPRHLQMIRLKDNEGSVVLACVQGRGTCSIRALAGTDNAARSFTGDLAIFDEAPRIDKFREALGGTYPAMIRTLRTDHHGQLVVGGSSKGPEGRFRELWDETYGEDGELVGPDGIGPTRFVPLFLSVYMRPGRTDEWYDEQKPVMDAIGPAVMKQEYPRSVDEAWEYAAGRVYPMFTRKRNVGVIEIPPHASRFRCIDWGETTSAFVVLWVAYMKGPPGLVVHPDCKATIREFLSYRIDEDTHKPEKKNDHCPDALRYGVMQHDCRGLVYVYREIYVKDSVTAGWTPYKEIARIHEMSGWHKCKPGDKRHYRRKATGEVYDLVAVADPTLGKVINEFNDFDLPCVGAEPIVRRGRKKVTIAPDKYRDEGIRHLRALIDGSEDMDTYYAITRDQQLEDVLLRNVRPRLARGTLDQTRLRALARSLLKKGR